MITVLLILDVIFVGVPVTVFVYCWSKGKGIDESLKYAYLAIILFILFCLFYLLMSTPDSNEQYVYIGLMFALMGMMLAVQGDIKATQRDNDLNLKIATTQEKIDRVVEQLEEVDQKSNWNREQLDRIERCLKDSIPAPESVQPPYSDEPAGLLHDEEK